MLSMIPLAACNWSTGVKQCGPETRVAEAYGYVVLTDGTSMANGNVTLFESRDPGQQAEVAGLAVNFQSDVLRGHVTKVELHDSGTPARLLGTYSILSLSSSLPPNIAGFQGPYDWSISLDEARTLIVGGQVAFEVQTDLANQPSVRFTLTSIGSNDWSRESGESCG